MFTRTIKLGLTMLVLLVMLSACSLSFKRPAPVSINKNNNVSSEKEKPVNNNVEKKEIKKATDDIKQFSSIKELQAFLAANDNSQSFTPNQRNMLEGAPQSEKMISMLVSKDVSSDTNTNSSNTSSNFDYSLTNNQVTGVDEADIVKIDANYAYVLVRNKLSIVKINPTDKSEIISNITFKSRPLDIYINGNRLIVFGYETNNNTGIFSRNSYVFFKVFDISDHYNPRQVRDLDIQGNYTDSRMIGDYVYIITKNSPSYVNRVAMAPQILSSGKELGIKPGIFYFDIPYTNYSYTTITAINIKQNKDKPNEQVFLLDRAQTFYVSQNNIYITYTKTLSEYEIRREVVDDLVIPVLSADEKKKISDIRIAPDYVLNNREKDNKVNLIVQNYLNSLNNDESKTWDKKIETEFKNVLAKKAKDMEKTIIYKIAIKDGDIKYKARGEVSGRVLNQFSMDEYNAYFRIATTRSSLWSSLTKNPSSSYSNVYVLDPDLKVIGQLENLATKERIYSVRFMGNRVYLVTFKQTDPLYVIDLSNLKKPKVLGAIKVPGYSTYLHPIDVNGTKLLGLGRDVEVDGDKTITKGIKLSLFDFSNLKNPKELDSYIIGDSRSSSIALYDHKAFLYSGSKKIVSIPAIFRDDKGKVIFSGAIVFGIGDKSLTLKGKIDHSDGGHFTKDDHWLGYNYYDNTVKRSRYFGDDLLTFSNKYIKINKISDLSTVKNIKLTPDSQTDFIIDKVSIPEVSGETIPSDTPKVDEGGVSSVGTSSPEIATTTEDTPL